MNNELRKNAEGYTDTTAAATLTQPEPADVWTYDGGSMCLVIKNHGPFCTILLLVDERGGPDDVKITTTKGPKYTDPRRLTYGRRLKIGRYLETVSVMDFEAAVEAVEDALAIDLPREVQRPTEKVGTQEADKLREEVAQLREDLRAMQDLARLKQEAANAAGRAEMKVKNQLELLRDMYNELLAKVVGGMVNDD